MKVRSYTTGGARRYRENTPELKISGSYSTSYLDGGLTEHTTMVQHTDGRTYEVIFLAEDVKRLLENIINGGKGGGRAWLQSILEAK